MEDHFTGPPSSHGGAPRPGRRTIGVRHLIARATGASERGEYATALLDLREVLERHPDFPDVRNRTGFCRAMLGDAEGALEEFSHALRVNPDYAEAHINRALVLNDLCRFDEGREAFARASELDPWPGDPLPAEVGNRIAEAHAVLGDLYLEAEQPANAVAEYTKALEVRPAFVDVRSRLARALIGVGEVESAVRELNRVIQERPSFLDARLLLGAALMKTGETDEAISEWRRCLEIEPRNAQAVSRLASAGVSVTEVTAPGVDGEGGSGN